MSSFPFDYIAIDTNVFEHLFNPEKNVNGHIHKILSILMEKETKLLVDVKVHNRSRIREEYKNRLIPIILNRPDSGKDDVLLLKYWILSAPKETVNVDNKDDLMVAIMRIIGQENATDRIFVYVAFKKGRVLLTNDRQNIIDKGNQKNVRRKKLLGKTKKIRPRKQDWSNILTSLEAEKHI